MHMSFNYVTFLSSRNQTTMGSIFSVSRSNTHSDKMLLSIARGQQQIARMLLALHLAGGILLVARFLALLRPFLPAQVPSLRGLAAVGLQQLIRVIVCLIRKLDPQQPALVLPAGPAAVHVGPAAVHVGPAAVPAVNVHAFMNAIAAFANNNNCCHNNNDCCRIIRNGCVVGCDRVG